ncbi:YncE family protein [Tenacibaculum sp. IMCC1]|uniref:Cell surface protein n=1 Tax=Tenacibaculum sp. Pbs-1 TaxID=3238748 RepID=A0AB33KR08_9FLAO
MKITKLLLQLFLVSIVLTSCSSEDKIVEVIRDKYDNGVIVSAEGVFKNKDGSISYVNKELTESQNFIYAGKNGALLGGLIQSIAFSETEAYIILNDVNTIVVVDRYTFEKKGQITTDLKNPRYMTIVNGKGYVTNWGETQWGNDIDDDYVTVINLNTLEVDSKIDVEIGPEQILNKDNKLYISHKGAYGSNNIVSVIDLNNNNTISTITVDDHPDEMAFDTAGNLIVLSEGKPVYNSSWEVIDRTTSSISFINLSNNEVIKSIDFPAKENASLMAYENGKIHYYKGKDEKVYSINEEDTALATEGVEVGGIYGMNVKDNNLYTVSYEFPNSELSNLTVYDLNTEAKVYKTKVGVGASKIYFN